MTSFGGNGVFISVKEACRIIGCSPPWLWKMIREGYGPPIKRCGRSIVVHKQRLINWCEQLEEGKN